MEYFNLLPKEITLDIITRLPTEDVLECKLVCTNWRSLVRHPSFSKMHFHHLNHPESDSGKTGFFAWTSIYERNDDIFQYFEYDENRESIERVRRLNFNPPFGSYTVFIESCNGLICFARDGISTETGLYICNPITREYINIKRVGEDHGEIGFGYVSTTNEYKVVRIMLEKETGFREVHIYTLGSGIGWRNIGKFNFGTKGGWKGTFLNGVFYWLDIVSRMIIPFDLAEEKFCEHLSLPSSQENILHDSHSYLDVLDGCLFFGINGLNDDGYECCDGWLLKKKNIEEREECQSMGWGEHLRVFDSHLFAITKNYGFLTSNDNHINIHDLEASTSKTLVEFTETFVGVFPHKNTLVSLKELGEAGTKIMESVETEETESHDKQLSEDEDELSEDEDELSEDEDETPDTYI